MNSAISLRNELLIRGKYFHLVELQEILDKNQSFSRNRGLSFNQILSLLLCEGYFTVCDREPVFELIKVISKIRSNHSTVEAVLAGYPKDVAKVLRAAFYRRSDYFNIGIEDIVELWGINEEHTNKLCPNEFVRLIEGELTSSLTQYPNTAEIIRSYLKVNSIKNMRNTIQPESENLTSNGTSPAPFATRLMRNAAQHIEDRAAYYDQPKGERSIPTVVNVFNAYTGKNLTEEEGWLFMGILKVVRSRQGSFKLDNHEDAAAYEALRAECLFKTEEEKGEAYVTK